MELGLSSSELEQCRIRGLKSAVTDYYKHRYRDLVYEGEANGAIKDPELEDAMKRIWSASHIGDQYFVTVTTKYQDSKVSPDDLLIIHERIRSIINLIWVKYAKYSFEVTGTGIIHTHMWIEIRESICPSQVHMRLCQSQIRWITTVTDSKRAKQFIDVKRCTKKQDKKNILKYICKNKKRDIDFRKKYNLKDSYTCHTGEDIDEGDDHTNEPQDH